MAFSPSAAWNCNNSIWNPKNYSNSLNACVIQNLLFFRPREESKSMGSNKRTFQKLTHPSQNVHPRFIFRSKKRDPKKQFREVFCPIFVYRVFSLKIGGGNYLVAESALPRELGTLFWSGWFFPFFSSTISENFQKTTFVCHNIKICSVFGKSFIFLTPRKYFDKLASPASLFQSWTSDLNFAVGVFRIGFGFQNNGVKRLSKIGWNVFIPTATVSKLSPPSLPSGLLIQIAHQFPRRQESKLFKGRRLPGPRLHDPTVYIASLCFPWGMAWPCSDPRLRRSAPASSCVFVGVWMELFSPSGWARLEHFPFRTEFFLWVFC